MPIYYILYENKMGNNSGGYAARPVSNGTITTKQLIDQMLHRGSTLTRPDLVAAMTLQKEVIIQFLLDGYRVDWDLVTFGLAIQGTFADPDERFVHSRHAVVPIATVSQYLRDLFGRKELAMRRIRSEVGADPRTFTDLTTDRINQIITPGGPAQIDGYRLKVDPDDPEQGVFFVSYGAGPDIRVPRLFRNKPGQLMFMIPADMPPGSYWVEVRSYASPGSLLGRASLPYMLTVPQADSNQPDAP